jgi:hypothetical protein
MSAIVDRLRHFLSAQTGAVSVEYVLLTAGALGIGIAAATELRGGLSFLSGTVTDELSGTALSDGSPTLAYSDGFGNGAPDWSGGEVVDYFGIGHALVPIAAGSPSVVRTFAMAPDVDGATISFDMLALDALDGESGTVFLGGQEIGRVTVTAGRPVVQTSGIEGIEIKARVIERETQLGGASIENGAEDARIRFEISLSAPGETVEFGFGSDVDPGLSRGTIAIDAFEITGLRDPDVSYAAGVAGEGGQDQGNAYGQDKAKNRGNAYGHDKDSGQGNANGKSK